MDIVGQYILWSATIYACMELIKMIPKLPQRVVPLIPPLLGVLSGYLIAPHVFQVPSLVGAFYGVGAAGVSAISFKVLRQTIQNKV